MPSSPSITHSNMKTLMPSALISFTLLLLIAILPFASTDLVDDTCKKTPYVNLCVLALRSDPRSSTADTPTLGLIMVDKVDANAKSTVTKIQDLLGKSPDPGMKKALTSCAESYDIIINSYVPPSKDGFTKGNYKFAQEYMSSVATNASNCEAGFGGKSPISDSNDFENEAASVASAIAGLLL